MRAAAAHVEFGQSCLGRTKNWEKTVQRARSRAPEASTPIIPYAKLTFCPALIHLSYQCLIHDLLRRRGSINEASFKRCLAQKNRLLAYPAIVVAVRNDYLRVTKDLKSPFFCSGGQAENLHILCVLALGDEFRERIAFCGSQEKIGKCLSQGVCNDKLRWRDAGTNGSQPGPE